MTWWLLIGGAALLAALAGGGRRARPVRRTLRRLVDLAGRPRQLAEVVLDELVRPLGAHLGRAPLPTAVALVDDGAGVAVTLRTDDPDAVAMAVLELGLPAWLVIVGDADVVVYLALTFTPDAPPALMRQVGAGLEEL